MDAEDAEEIRRWAHCMSQLAGVYGRISLDGDLENRLKVLESQAVSSNGHR
jgi:hypothetical protein